MAGLVSRLLGFLAASAAMAGAANAQVTGWSDYRNIWTIQTRDDAILITPATNKNIAAASTQPNANNDPNCTDRSAYPVLMADSNYYMIASLLVTAFSGNDEFRVYYDGCYATGPYAGMSKVLRIEIRQNYVVTDELLWPVDTDEVP